MGFGFLEAVYAKCLMIELTKAGLVAVVQYPVAVYYDDQLVGEYLADVLVEGEVILELKSVRQLALIHEVQLVNYLTATGKDVGLVINFGEHTVEVKRKVRVLEESF
jgi:GxxExxY protein